MKWQAVVTGELASPVGGRDGPRPSAGAVRTARPQKSARKLPAHACLALIMLGSTMR
jgi:hypothetical protein